jgi:4a-hydroxytetrahydrobiopterin dehydratase
MDTRPSSEDPGDGWIPEGWVRDGERLRRTFRFADFDEAWRFMNAVADVARRLDHHPDWSNSWNVVEISLTTHSRSQVTGLDLLMAEEIGRLAGD